MDTRELREKMAEIQRSINETRMALDIADRRMSELRTILEIHTVSVKVFPWADKPKET